MSKNQDSTKPVVAVFGAAGYTGRFVIAELLSRKMKPVAIARNSKALSGANFPQSEVSLRQAVVDDAASLDRALHDAQVVINCAGPFVDTADAVASAALRAGIHYVDVAAEQLRLTAEKMKGFGLIDGIIPEPPGGAHWDYNESANIVKNYIIPVLKELRQVPADERIRQRIEKFGKMGFWEEA